MNELWPCTGNDFHVTRAAGLIDNLCGRVTDKSQGGVIVWLGIEFARWRIHVELTILVGLLKYVGTFEFKYKVRFVGNSMR